MLESVCLYGRYWSQLQDECFFYLHERIKVALVRHWC